MFEVSELVESDETESETFDSDISQPVFVAVSVLLVKDMVDTYNGVVVNYVVTM